jgi:hypothetical protein
MPAETVYLTTVVMRWRKRPGLDSHETTVLPQAVAWGACESLRGGGVAVGRAARLEASVARCER